MNFVPHTDAERTEMLSAIGVQSIQDLTRQISAAPLELHIPSGLSEGEVLQSLRALSCKNKAADDLACYIGGGAYEHFIPAAVGSLQSRGEFLTSYTPYQPEVSQGTLQAIFEYQTIVTELFGMDVSNSSMYDGSTALVEAALMAIRETGRAELVYPETLHPDTRAILKTYTAGMSVTLKEIPCPSGVLNPADAEKAISDKTAALLVQSPNFLGGIESMKELGSIAHQSGALWVASVNPLSLGLLAAPGEYGADIAVGEGQPFGVSLGYGGPYVGLLTCTQKLLRKLPGRLVGMTKDLNGKRAFVLTLQAREQHIRREKATSNICTSQALIALGFTIHLSLLGKQGLREMAYQNLAKSHYAFEQLTKIPGVRPVFPAPFFNEFVLQTKISAEELQSRLLEKGILGGLPLAKWYKQRENQSLWCVTETKSKEQLDKLVSTVKEVLA